MHKKGQSSMKNGLKFLSSHRQKEVSPLAPGNFFEVSGRASKHGVVINARFLGLCQMHRAGAKRLGLVVLGTGKVVGRRRMPECMTEPEK